MSVTDPQPGGKPTKTFRCVTAFRQILGQRRSPERPQHLAGPVTAEALLEREGHARSALAGKAAHRKVIRAPDRAHHEPAHHEPAGPRTSSTTRIGVVTGAVVVMIGSAVLAAAGAGLPHEWATGEKGPGPVGTPADHYRMVDVLRATTHSPATSHDVVTKPAAGEANAPRTTTSNVPNSCTSEPTTCANTK